MEQARQIFYHSCDTDINKRKSAENELNRLKKEQGFLNVVLQVLGNSTSGEDIHIAAAIFLKNVVKEHWPVTSDWTLPQADKAAVRTQITSALLSTKKGPIQNCLSEAVTVICQSDFPGEWPELVPDLVGRADEAFKSLNVAMLSNVLTVLHSIFCRYREVSELTNELVDEIIPCIERVGPVLLPVTQWLVDELLKPHQAGTLSEILTLFNSCIDIFYDFTCLDLPDFITKHLGHFMQAYISVLKFETPLFNKDASESPSILARAKATVTEMLTVFLRKFDEDFEDYLERFAETIWMMLTRLTDGPRDDDLAIAAMDFLAATAQSFKHTVFQDPQILHTVCNQIILPNIRIRQLDVEMFEDEPEEYIRRDIEGSDQHTRRRVACEFTHALCKNYQTTVSGIFQEHIASLLQSYSNNEADWKSKDAAIYLTTALSIKQSCSTVVFGGVRSTNQVDIVAFFTQHILPELGKGCENASTNSPVLKADGIKFISTFRNQIPKEHYPACIELLGKWVLSPSEVVMTYAASAIERLLTVRDATGQPFITKEVITPLASTLFMNLFSALRKAIRENRYLIMCVTRVIRRSQDLIGPLIPPLLEPLVSIINHVTRNPSNPSYNHYLFESVSCLIRYNPEHVGSIEMAIFEPFALVLQKDVVEFMPYVFQIFAQMMETRSNVPQSYYQLVETLCSPQLYQNKGNIPAIIRFLTVFIEKVPQRLVDDGLLNSILGIFQVLANNKLYDHEGFTILNAVVLHVPSKELEQLMPSIMKILFGRLANMKTVKFCKMFILFSCILIHKRGADYTLNLIESLQSGLWAMVFTNVWCVHVTKVIGDYPRKACIVALVKLICDSQVLQSNSELWAKAVQCLCALVLNEKSVDKEGATFEASVYTAENLKDRYEDGYTNAYCPLVGAIKEEGDLCSDIPDVAQFLSFKWQELKKNANYGAMAALLQRSLSTEHQAFISRF